MRSTRRPGSPIFAKDSDKRTLLSAGSAGSCGSLRSASGGASRRFRAFLRRPRRTLHEYAVAEQLGVPTRYAAIERLRYAPVIERSLR